MNTSLRIILFIIATAVVLPGAAQKKDKKNKSVTAAKDPSDSTKKKEPLKPYKKLIAKAKTQKGLFTVHKIEQDYYFEIPDSLFGREFIAITRLAKTPAGGGYGGEEENEQVLRWERGPNNKVFLRGVLHMSASLDTLKPMMLAVSNSNIDPIAAVFDIKSLRKDTSVVINVTSFFQEDNRIVSLNPNTKRYYNLTKLEADRSYIQSVKSFPINTEIRMVKTFEAQPLAPGAGNGPVPVSPLAAGESTGFVTMELNSSMILLPSTPARKRLFDNRIGYFASGYTVYGEESKKSDVEVFAVRWRLEPKRGDEEKIKHGELVEPKKPIVFYIDPATPVKWRKYIKAGVDDWQKAFEQAGFKNAIIGKEIPAGDTTISTEDARYSFIRYFASDIQNAYGPNISDPRTGEIIESHIGWYHNVMSLLTSWYTIQAAAVDPRARKKEFDDELMGNLIRFVASHEVGHTLGLRHNFGSSSATPVEKLRDKAYMEKYGHTSSIMDYARFNYVAQPEDGITNLFPGIGEYDKWAIEWGYKPIFGTKSAMEDKKILNKWTVESLKDSRHWFGTEINSYDPRSQSEDLGDNSMTASEYGIKNLKRIVPSLMVWYKNEAENYTTLDEMYGQVISQYRRYMGHVAKNVGGIYETPKTYDQDGVVFEPTPAALQRSAVQFLNKQLFETPTWLLDQKILGLTKPGVGVEQVQSMQEITINRLFDYARMQRLIESSVYDAKAYSLDNLFTDLQAGIWSELPARKSIDNFRRNLQKIYVEKMASLLNPDASRNQGSFNFSSPFFPSSPASPVADPRKSDVISIARGHLIELKGQINAALPGISDKMSRYHLQDVLERIDVALYPKK